MTHTQRQLFNAMLAQSFHPRQWYTRDDSLDPPAEVKAVWCYIQTTSGFWEVGFFDPTKVWHADNQYYDKEDAAQRVHFLNGGEGDPHGIQEAITRPAVGEWESFARRR